MTSHDAGAGMSGPPLEERIEALREKLVERLQKHREGTFSRNEAQVRKSLVEPVLEELGWKCDELDQVRVEDNAGAADGASNRYPDYVLLGPEGKPWSVLEVKPTGAADRDTVREQAAQQASKAGAALYAITDGEYWQISDPSRRQAGYAEKALTAWTLTEEPAPKELLALLARPVVMNGDADVVVDRLNMDYARRRSVIEKLPGVWAGLLERPNPDIVAALQLAAEGAGLQPTAEEVAECVRGCLTALSQAQTVPAMPTGEKQESKRKANYTHEKAGVPEGAELELKDRVDAPEDPTKAWGTATGKNKVRITKAPGAKQLEGESMETSPAAQAILGKGATRGPRHWCWNGASLGQHRARQEGRGE